MPRLTEIRKQAVDGLMKEAFFEATISVLDQHGAEGMTMDRVASAARVAKGSLYRYFHSKRDLLEFVHAKLTEPVFEVFEELAGRKQPAVEKLAEQLRWFFDHIARHLRAHRLLFDDANAHSLLQSSVRRTADAVSKQFERLFRQGIAEGAFQPGDPAMMAHMYFGLCRGVLRSGPPLEEPEQREALCRLILNTFLNGISVEKRQIG